MRGRRLWMVALVVVILLLALAGSARLFLWPATTQATRADAVVVLGARSARAEERLGKALELVDQGVAPVLVVSSPPPNTALCSGHGRVTVICFEPSPFTTRGEAAEVGRLAAARGWSSLALVTSTYHVTRARLLFDRCFPGELDVVGAKPDAGFGKMLERILHEWAGLAEALVVTRGC